MNTCWHRLSRISLTLGVVAFLLIGSLGLSHFAMTMGMDGKMSAADCPFMSICTMSPLEHIATWQSMFASIPPQQSSTLALLFVISITLAGLFWITYIFPLLENQKHRPRNYYTEEYILVPIPVQELFSSGILNPKLF